MELDPPIFRLSGQIITSWQLTCRQPRLSALRSRHLSSPALTRLLNEEEDLHRRCAGGSGVAANSAGAAERDGGGWLSASSYAGVDSNFRRSFPQRCSRGR